MCFSKKSRLFSYKYEKEDVLSLSIVHKTVMRSRAHILRMTFRGKMNAENLNNFSTGVQKQGEEEKALG